MIDRKLVFCVRLCWRCAGEGELVFGLTKHEGSFSRRGDGRQQVICPRSAGLWRAQVDRESATGPKSGPHPPGLRAHPTGEQAEAAAFQLVST